MKSLRDLTFANYLVRIFADLDLADDGEHKHKEGARLLSLLSSSSVGACDAEEVDVLLGDNLANDTLLERLKQALAYDPVVEHEDVGGVNQLLLAMDVNFSFLNTVRILYLITLNDQLQLCLIEGRELLKLYDRDRHSCTDLLEAPPSV
eukprot:CAMPEP_0170513294 /NCGR_PEP_ID=MMETSP0208-20121228/67324_1 /TAXON_ID=197538 /ORGANISM="Strombidium inclinatum, Strain S3" /LENGTH=148 /DNA_ID=CAMNT_0010797017 /DNA_START=1379 /DNA_END=1825 /DNA_ORIENTATION=+